jgi:hypothetical protein
MPSRNGRSLCKNKTPALRRKSAGGHVINYSFTASWRVLRFCRRGGGGVFLPCAFQRFDQKAFFNGLGTNPNVANFAVNHRFHALEIGEKATLGDSRNVRADAAALLSFTTAPNNAALNRALSSQFTYPSHKLYTPNSKGKVKYQPGAILQEVFLHKPVDFALTLHFGALGWVF